MEVETRSDRRALASEAGVGRISIGSVIAGTLVAYGAFAVLAAIAGVIIDAVGVDTNLSADDWRRLGTGGGIAVAVVLLLSYLYGGYVAGRMARRSGAWNGLLVFFLGVLAAVGIGAVVNQFTNTAEITRNLRSLGIPTRAGEWRDVGTVAGIASLVAMFLGSIIGGMLGERWHTKLTRRAAADVGAEPPAEPHAVEGAEPVVTRRESEADREGDRDMLAAPTID
ncbi:MAG TPA: TIGR04086 family membrane protein [Acidimicrobiales bacterium]|nr:TIGR04086 family membrane protein [Acidimicrobiales bacterium]